MKKLDNISEALSMLVVLVIANVFLAIRAIIYGCISAIQLLLLAVVFAFAPKDDNGYS